MKLVADRLTVRLGGRTILREVGADFPESGVTLVIGGNGCGKSTLLKTLAGILSPVGGTVTLDGTPLDRLSRKETARRCAILLQEPYAPPELTVRALTALGRFPYGGGGADAVARAMTLAGVTELADRKMGTLSGGEKHKAFLARALAQGSGVLLLDEPEAALDAAARDELLRTLKRLRAERGLTVVMAVHDLDFGLDAADMVCGLKSGELRFAGPPEAATPDVLRELYGLGSTVFRDATGRLRAIPDYRS